MSYVDGFVLPLPANKIEEYRKIADHAGKIWKEHGALSYRECVADDTNAHGMVEFPKMAGTKEGEVVVIAFIEFNSRQHRDEVNAKVMADPRIHESCAPENMPFDHLRMAYGGFKTIVSH